MRKLLVLFLMVQAVQAGRLDKILCTVKNFLQDRKSSNTRTLPQRLANFEEPELVIPKFGPPKPRRISVKPDQTNMPKKLKGSLTDNSPLKPKEIHYNVYGADNKETIVFIPGLDSNSTAFDPVIDELSKKYRVVTYDQRGHRYTVERGNDLSPSVLAKDLKVLLDHLGIEQANIVGHSMGGRVAMEFASEYPANVNKLVIEDMELHARYRAAPNVRQRELQYVEQNKDFPTVFNSREECYAALAPVIGESDAKILVKYRTGDTPDGKIRLFVRPHVRHLYGASGNRVDFAQQISEWEKPLYVISAEPNRSAISPRGLKHLKEHAKDLRYEVVEDGRHSVHWSQPERFNQTLENMLQEN